MKKIKYLLVAFALSFSNIAFAVWSAPTVGPSANNAQPPLNMGSVQQSKSGPLGATQFCLYNSTLNSYTDCTKPLGGGWSAFVNNIVTGKGDVKADDVITVDHLTKWINVNAGEVTIGDSSFYEIPLGNNVSKLCVGSSASPTCFGNISAQSSVGIPGILGKDGSTYSCNTKDDVLQWDGLKFKCATVPLQAYVDMDTLDKVTGPSRDIVAGVRSSNITANGISVGSLIVDGGAVIGTTIRIKGGLPAPNKILTSIDTNGNATWKTIDEIIAATP